jgi:hypothetical protein
MSQSDPSALIGRAPAETRSVAAENWSRAVQVEADRARQIEANPGAAGEGTGRLENSEAGDPFREDWTSIRRAQAELAAAREELEACREAHARVLRSMSWRITAPLRVVVRLVPVSVKKAIFGRSR